MDEPMPLRLVGTRLYLDRYWREERSVAADLTALGHGFASGVSISLLADGIARLFGEGGDPRQCCAAACAVLRRLSVIAGGPGTGKTTTVARVAALLYEQALAAGSPPPLVALTAFTGKAAARLEELVHHEARSLEVDPALRAWLLELRAGTIHRLLGTRPGSHTAFRHNRSNGLPHDAVIVDETSMVSLSLMARLLEAVRADARVVLVGDPGQLTAIEAGAVLRDIVGPAGEGLRLSAPMRTALEEATGRFVVSDQSDVELGDGIVVLERVHRYGEGIARIAEAVRRGDGDATIGALRAARPAEVVWLPVDVAEEAIDLDSALGDLRAGAVAAGRAVLDAAGAGDARAALDGAVVVPAALRAPARAAWRERVDGSDRALAARCRPAVRGR